ncbi:MAG: hypothetical protein M1816_005467 [Peltula sp. TS41687]|nr:MAG: hypothetical protein M1816_005467 [Peltula sp. TS41687]
MPTAGKLLANNARITVNEFYNALSVTWRGSSILNGGKQVPVGLAISGGVDSMALATLCTELSTANPTLGLQFKALIVDHSVRKESASEALKITSVLETMGISSKILRLTWPEGSDHLKSPNFETTARILRFRALGRACIQEGFNALLFGHHADDQAETVLMRLSRGHRGIGLQGIKPVIAMPESFGIYRVYQSGSPHRDVKPEPRKERSGKSKLDTQMLDYEGGGVTVCRPLLKFSKERLTATCVDAGTKWFEDHTNKDISLTPRNSIRHLLQNDRLPRALRKPSLLGIADVMHQHELRRTERMEWLVGRCEFLMFDTRTGSLVVRLPKMSPKDYTKLSGLEKDSTGAETWAIAARLVSRLARLVTSMETINLSGLHEAITLMFPDIAAPGEATEPGAASRKVEMETPRVTGGNVDFRRVWRPLTRRPPNLDPSAIKDLDHDHVWVLIRSMYRSDGTDCPTLVIPDISQEASGHKLTSSASDPPQENKKDSEWSPWHLWDGRFWIRVMNKTGHPVTIRPFRKNDIEPFRRSLQLGDRKQLDNMLHRVAPDHVRFTLPAILGYENDQVLALPTLHLVNEKELEGERLLWQVRYKMIDLDMIR